MHNGMNSYWISILISNRAVASGGLGALAPPVFGRTVNPISTRRADYYAHHSTTSPPPGFSDLATALQQVYKVRKWFEIINN